MLAKRSFLCQEYGRMIALVQQERALDILRNSKLWCSYMLDLVQIGSKYAMGSPSLRLLRAAVEEQRFRSPRIGLCLARLDRQVTGSVQ